MNADPNPAKAVFLEAVERHAPDQWPAFLDRACAGRPEVRGQVEALLQAHQELGTQHRKSEGSADPVATDDRSAAAESPGVVIGPYKLIEPVGEGGMGVVWLAQQSEPVKRLVALKLIKSGMDSKQVIARFEAERQALALMDHPNIARVLDGGTTANGRPYFVMDLVKGVPITKYCDEHHLTPRQRLELFLPVCHAIQHAHQKGIIHRDLKPSNVLVAAYDSRPVPKVIDFGVAKAAGQTLTDKTLVTGLGNIVGTLEYMSPEQAEVNQLDVDTRCDIYSLGVLLYELLTGSPPFSRKELENAGVLEMLRVIREQEPSKPSTKLSTAEGLPSLAANRGTEPAKLTKLVRGELDWIVMKALEKDRSRRYETASSFAMDVQRYLADEPVQACPPSRGYRLRKFGRRHRGPVLAASVILLLLLGGIVGTTVGLIRSEIERARAVSAERGALAAAENERQARLDAQKAERTARDSEADTKAFSDFLVNDVLSAARPAGERGGLGSNVTVRQALQAAEQRIDATFKGRPRAEAVARHDLGVTLRMIGELEQAEPHLRRALTLRKEVLGPEHEDTLASLNSLAVVLNSVGKHVEATPLLEDALERRREKLGPNHAVTLTLMVNLAMSYRLAGRLDLALPLLEQALERRTATLGPTDPATIDSMSQLARGYHAAKKLDLALPLYERALERQRVALGPDDSGTIAMMNNLAGGFYDAGKLELALPLFQEAATAVEKRKFEHQHADRIVRNLIDCHERLKQLARAEDWRRKWLAVVQAKRRPESEYAAELSGLGANLCGQRKFADAAPILRESLTIRRRIAPDHAETIHTMVALGDCYRATNEFDIAGPLYEEALKLRTAKLGSDNPSTLQVMNSLTAVYQAAGKFDRALPFLQKAADGAEKREFTDKNAALVVFTLINCHEKLEQFDRAEAWRRKLLALVQKRNGPQSTAYGWELAGLGGNLLRQKKFAEAEPPLRDGLTLLTKNWPEEWMTFAVKSNLGACLLGQRKHAEAEPLLLQGYEGLKQRQAKITPPEDRDLRLRQAIERLVQLYDDSGKQNEAAMWRRELEARKAPSGVGKSKQP